MNKIKLQKKEILIVTSFDHRDRFSASLIVDKLEEKGIKCHLFKFNTTTKDAGDEVFFDSDADCEERLKIVIEKQQIDMRNIDLIYWWHPSLPTDIMRFPNIEYRDLITKQFTKLKESIYLLGQNKKFFNNPLYGTRAENKIWQLNEAREIGLKIPKTLITNNPDRVINFYKQNKKVIVKPLTVGILPDKMIFTRELKDSDLNELSKTLKYAPCIFQETIIKKKEFRAVAVGNKIFTAEIYSQDKERSKLDWRFRTTDDKSLPFMQRGQLPKEYEHKLLELKERLNLDYASMDIIEDINGELIFLEVNPYGQSIFVENATGFDISGEIANIIDQKISNQD